MKALVVLALLAATPAMAANGPAPEELVTLKPAAGLEVVNQNCGGCHSLDYVRMNAPFLNADVWKAEVTKMRNAFGAQLTDADAAAIQKYLTDNYGPPAS